MRVSLRYITNIDVKRRGKKLQKEATFNKVVKREDTQGKWVDA